MEISNELKNRVLANFYDQYDALERKAKSDNTKAKFVHVYFMSFISGVFDKAVFNKDKQRFTEIQIQICDGYTVIIEGLRGGWSEDVKTVYIKINSHCIYPIK